MIKKILCVTLSCSLMFSSLVFANEEETENSNNTTGSSWLADNLGGTFNQTQFTLATVPDNSSALNMKYVTLLTEMEENGFGAEYSFDMPDSLSVSGNANDIFEKEYGDIDFNVEKLEVPEDFNVKDYLNNEKELAENSYDKFINSGNYEKIFNSLSTSTVTETVKNKLSNPESLVSLLEDTETRKALLYGSQTSEQSNLKNQYASSLTDAMAQFSTQINNLNNDPNHIANQQKAQASIKSLSEQIANGVQYPILDMDKAEALKNQINNEFGKDMAEAMNDAYDVFSGNSLTTASASDMDSDDFENLFGAFPENDPDYYNNYFNNALNRLANDTLGSSAWGYKVVDGVDSYPALSNLKGTTNSDMMTVDCLYAKYCVDAAAADIVPQSRDWYVRTYNPQGSLNLSSTQIIEWTKMYSWLADNDIYYYTESPIYSSANNKAAYEQYLLIGTPNSSDKGAGAIYKALVSKYADEYSKRTN